MQKKDDKVGNKTANNEERQRKKEEQGRQIKVDSQQKKVQILGLCVWVKNKKLFNYVQLVGKYTFYVAKLTFSHPYAN